MAGQNDTGKRSSANRVIGGLFNYRWIVKNSVFFMFLSTMAIIYIANGHMSDNRIRKINDTGRRLKDLQYEYKTLKSEMMFKSRESQMVKIAEPLGLTRDTAAPYKIRLISRKGN